MFIALFGFGFRYFLNYRDWLDWEKDVILNVRPGNCTTILENGGAEDVTHIGNGVLLMSTGLSFSGSIGKLQMLDLQDHNKLTPLNILNAPKREDLLAGPHGISTWRDPNTDQLFLYVITHPVEGDRVEVFEVLKSFQLQYIRSITDPLFKLMNDLVAVGKDKFYITKSIHFRKYIVLEWISHLKFGGIYYYDGNKAREVIQGYHVPNGINISPDKKMIYVAEWGTRSLKGLRIDSSNNLVEEWSVNTGTGIDNIEVDPDSGDLWIGAIPITWKILMGRLRPSQVIRVKMRENKVSEMETIYQDDGRNIAGSSVATFAAGKIVVGSVTDQAIVCDVNYLTPNN